MTDGPKRLRTSSNDALLTGLLEVAREERPSAAALQRALIAVGGAGVALTASSGSAAAATSASASGATSAAAGSSVGGAAAGASGAGVSGAGVSGAVVSGAGVSGAGVSGAVVSGGGAAGTALGTTGVAAKLTFGSSVVAVGKWVGIGAVGIGVATQAPEWTRDAMTGSSEQAAAVGTATISDTRTVDATAGQPGLRLAPRGELPSGFPSGAPSAESPADQHADPAENGVAATGGHEVARGAKGSSGDRAFERLPSIERSGAATGTRSVPEVTTVGADEAIAAELQLVDAARSSLQGGAPQTALSLLDGYERTFPRRQLIVEVVVLRMEAAHALGQTHRAAGFARRVLGMAGSSPHAARAKEVLRVAEQSEQRETEH